MEVNKELNKEGFSLPTQRCFLRTAWSLRRARLFSAYAEVFLIPEIERLNR